VKTMACTGPGAMVLRFAASEGTHWATAVYSSIRLVEERANR
jgi:hypothetical protein